MYNCPKLCREASDFAAARRLLSSVKLPTRAASLPARERSAQVQEQEQRIDQEISPFKGRDKA